MTEIHCPQSPRAIQAELAKIEAALHEPQTDERYVALYAAQQALTWAINPDIAMPPYVAIQLDRVRPLPVSASNEWRHPWMGVAPSEESKCGSA